MDQCLDISRCIFQNCTYTNNVTNVVIVTVYICFIVIVYSCIVIWFLSVLLLQYRKSASDHFSSPCHSWHGGRSHWLLPRPHHLRALSTYRHSAVDRGRRSQWRRALQSVPGASKATNKRWARWFQLTYGQRGDTWRAAAGGVTTHGGDRQGRGWGGSVALHKDMSWPASVCIYISTLNCV